jgi:seryl-tRNA synthetase
MLDRRFVREHPDVVKKKFAERGLPSASVDAHLALDEKRRELLQKVEELKHLKNTVSREIGELKKKGKDAEDKVAEMRRVGDDIAEMEEGVAAVDKEMLEIELSMPNLQDGSVPVGKASEDNAEIHKWGEPPEFSFEPRPHWEVGEGLGILDFERAAKIAGARFALLRGAGARMERALIDFMLDIHTREHGYEEVLPPFMVNRESLVGTGQLPKFEKDLFGVRDSGYYLVPTAEVPVTNIHRGEILDEAALPVKYAAYTPCFRSEAGSYGKDTRGYIRQHQFNKVELVKFATPETSFDELESLTEAPSPPLPRRLALLGRPGLRLGEDLRPRGVASLGEGLQRNFLLLQFHRLPGAPRRPALPPRRGQGEGALRAHPQRLGPRRGPDARRRPGAVPERGRHRHGSRGAAPLHGRPGAHRAGMKTRIRNFFELNENVKSGAQPTPEDLGDLSEQGCRAVLNLRAPGEEGELADERERVEALGMRYDHVPVTPGILTPESVEAFGKAMAEGEKPLFMHCGAGNRCSAMWLLHRVLNEGAPRERALEEARTMGLDPSVERLVLALLDEFGKNK